LKEDGQGESVQSKFKALDLAMAIPNKKKFENYRNLNEKGKASKDRKEQRKKDLEENLDDDLESIYHPYGQEMFR
jgi:predicted  nucleic acid-binding Zn-ribbon protein